MRLILIVIMLSYLFLSCSNESQKHGKVDSISSKISKGVEADSTIGGYSFLQVADFETKVVYNGDKSAYRTLVNIFKDQKYGIEIFFYSLIMAHKYNYFQAYYDVFTELTIVYGNNIYMMYEKTAKMAVDYLFMAAERGHRQAKAKIKKLSLNRRMDDKLILKKIYPASIKVRNMDSALKLNGKYAYGKEDIRFRVIYNGDKSEYDHLASRSELNEGTLIYSLIMANKYNYNHAYYHVVLELIENYGEKKDMMDEKTAKMAVDYLFMAAQKGHEQATETIKDYSLNRNMDNIIILKKIFPGEF